MMDVVLLYDGDCPNVVSARANLAAAFEQLGLPAHWREVDRGAADTPAAWLGYGSPTILVNGLDVCGLEPTTGGPACRIYASGEGLSGAPPVSAIAAALGGSAPDGSVSRPWVSVLAAAPGIGVALLPNLACPACWPAYAGLLSALGLGFLIGGDTLLVLTLLGLTVALGAIGWRATSRRGYGPLVLALGASVGLLVGKFHFESALAQWVGVAALVLASGWSARPPSAPRPSASSCPTCPPIAPSSWGHASGIARVY